MNRPDDDETDGHAAVGFVMGQRRADGTHPELVEIEYERHGSTRTATVYRTSGRVEFSKPSTVQFVNKNNQSIIIDELLGAHVAARPTQTQ